MYLFERTHRAVVACASRSRPVLCLILLFGSFGGFPCLGTAQPPDRPADPPTANQRAAQEAAAGELFHAQVLPLLRQKCLPCHGNQADDLKGGFSMLSRADLLNGGESGEGAIVPGDAAASPLYRAVRWADLEMPPKQNDRLTAAQIDLIRQWIEGGAPWPQATAPAPHTAAAGVQVATSGGLSDDWTNRRYGPEEIWAYRPVRRVSVPAAGDSEVNTPRHPIDAFVKRRLQEAGIPAAAPADRPALARRLTFDLTGLPPTADELDRFLADQSPGAYNRLVERLLASPGYGQQMARHWLDVVRYADTSGFSNDFERPHAWRYRDYVIRSFQNDKPFDQFVTEQIAGDELDPDNADHLIAVGFLRMGPWEHTGMSVAALTRQQFLDDVTHSVGVTFLGQGLRCARCHDHKFDPIPTRDYYRIQAVFAPVQFAHRDVPFRSDENTQGEREHEQRVRGILEETRRLQAELQDRKQRRVAQLLSEHGVQKVSELPESLRESFAGLTDEEKSAQKMYVKRIAYFERALNRYQPLAMSVYDGPDNNYQSTVAVFKIPPPARRTQPPSPVHILAGGSLEAPLDAVSPGVLSGMMCSTTDASNPEAHAEIPNTTAGRRLAFARWVASEQNTLTARVIVNRVWQMHFGTGIVATPNNFGRMGAKPTHPDLLDWLATWFVEHDWSLKQLHRLIVTSDTYRRQSDHPLAQQVAQRDPGNRLLSFFPLRRLAAEELRDSLLSISGELSDQCGGPGVFPEIHWEVALQPRHIMGAVAPAYQPSPRPEQRNRRTIYTFRYRTLADPLLEVFNKPSSDISCERRDETTVTPQVFALLNSQFVQDRAVAMAVRLEKTFSELDPQLQLACQLAWGRPPTAEELQLARGHVRRMTEYHHQHPRTPQKLPVTVQREMFEELTGQTFTFTEQLDVMQNYQSDLKPWDVGPATRALADFCLVLMNSDEFVYVR